VKRGNPDKFVFTYQGDGDLAAIGTAETIHAATRGENITVIFINNTTYGMTGGQMAPTTLPGQVTQTTPYGRDTSEAGFPVKVCEILSQIDGVALAERVTVVDPANIKKAKAAIRKAFEYQKKKQGFSLVEVLSTCPTNWGMTPVQALERVKTEMIPYYPLGVYKDGAVRNKEEN
ncbi:MAG: 2-oxoglutarate oxidoreductase, partial [Oscillospiraceae bacterium]|nr:2-oxoglutarate oxidoreductase [Oscillospiraceae bacterium]